MTTQRGFFVLCFFVLLLMVLFWFKDISFVGQRLTAWRQDNSEECALNDNTPCLPNPFFSICKKANVTLQPLYKIHHPWILRNILLLIVLNAPLYENIPYLEYMYRRYFGSILYCGEDKHKFELLQRTFWRKLDFVEVSHHKGEWGYLCMMRAVQMNYTVDGFLHISDDVLLNVWNLPSLSRDNPWFYEVVLKSSRAAKRVPDVWKNRDWWPWRSSMGRASLLGAWKDFGHALAHGSAQDKVRIEKFLRNLATSTGSEILAYYYPSDIWYLPVSLAEEFTTIMAVFEGRRTYLEIAIPTVLFGLGRPVLPLSGKYLWYQERTGYADAYSPQKIFLHPFKLAVKLRDGKGTDFICKRYLAYSEHIIYKME